MNEFSDILTINNYFPDLSDLQTKQFSQLSDLYRFWNDKINVVSRKDIDKLIVRHVLHSLAILKVVQFRPHTTLIDVGTGGGFPGIPIAIMNPQIQCTLIDSIAKKISVVNEIAHELYLSNVNAIKANSKHFKGKYNYITGRAVTSFPVFYNSVKHLFKNSHIDDALIYLKGGDFEDELKQFKKIKTYHIKKFFNEPFFETKKIIVLKQK